MYLWKNNLTNALIGTAVLINLVLAVMLVVQNQVPIHDAVPSLAETSSKPALKTEYVMELQGKSQKKPYLVEHYREIEIQYDEKGNPISKKPTGNQTHLRYWQQ